MADVSDDHTPVGPEASNDDVRGVGVRRVELTTKLITGEVVSDCYYSDGDGPYVAGEKVPGQWHSLAPEAQAARREALVSVLRANPTPDAVLRVLGLST